MKAKALNPLDTEKVKMIEVKSSNIAKIGYDRKARTLVIEFKPGKKKKVGPRWMYYTVTSLAYKQFKESKSKGEHFNQYIKNNTFITAEKINDGE